MAIPKSLKPIKAESAERIIEKHLKAGTGYWEDGGFEYSFGDFLYTACGKEYPEWLIRRSVIAGHTYYERGKVSM